MMLADVKTLGSRRKMTCFHASGTGHAHPLEEAAQLFELLTYPIIHSGQELLISCDLSAVWEMRQIVHSL